jgi:hypothetical protein
MIVPLKKRVLLRLRVWLGKLLNAIGFPGITADGEYDAGICKGKIQVKRTPLFTVVSVNELEIYFHRLTGQIKSVGFSEASFSSPVEAPKPAHIVLRAEMPVPSENQQLLLPVEPSVYFRRLA